MSKPAVLSLYRSLLRASSSFSDYNLRSYASRRVRDGFRDGKASPDGDGERMRRARESLELIRRQTTVANLFPGGKNVMENIQGSERRN